MSYIKDLYFDTIVRQTRLATCTVAPTAPVAPATVQVVSSKGDTTYTVALDGSSCTCKGFQFRGRCKHAERQRAA